MVETILFAGTDRVVMQNFLRLSRILCAAVAIGALFISGQAFASTVVVDGVKTAGEYTGPNSGSRQILWFNDHHSIYTEAAGNMNPLVYEINGSVDDFSLNLFFEVPAYARRMIWADGCKYNGGGVSSDCSSLAPDGATGYLDAYFEGSHHSDVDMKYDTQTGSEYFQLNGGTEPVFNKIKWQDEDNNGTDDGFTWATSREFLISENICSLTLCTEFDTTASIELLLLGLGSVQEALDIVASVESMQLHLSDEARNLPAVTTVPLPASLPLLGLGFIGLFVMARSRNSARVQ